MCSTGFHSWPAHGMVSHLNIATCGCLVSSFCPDTSSPGVSCLNLIGSLATATRAHPSRSPPPVVPLRKTHPGEVLPKKLLEKIRSRQFVDMKELLSDNISLLQQLEATQGCTAVQVVGAARPRLREVTSLASWCYCFLGYMAVLTTDTTTRDQLAYARNPFTGHFTWHFWQLLECVVLIQGMK